MISSFHTHAVIAYQLGFWDTLCYIKWLFHSFYFQMPFPSKRKLSSTKNGFKKGHTVQPEKKAKVQPDTRNSDTGLNQTTEREHEEPVVLERKLRKKTVNNDQITANNDGNIMLMQHDYFDKTIQFLFDRK